VAALGAAQLPSLDEADCFGTNLRHQFAPRVRRETTGGLRGAEGLIHPASGGKREQAIPNLSLARFHEAASKVGCGLGTIKWRAKARRGSTCSSACELTPTHALDLIE